MSDQEKKGSLSVVGSSVVMVEQTTDSRHKHPYRPTEVHDENEMYQKHSKAAVVPSVAEELKNLNEDSTNDNVEIREQKEGDHAMSSKNHKRTVGKKISSNTKRREPSPESIPLAPIEVDKKRESIILPTQPIPPDVDAAVSGASDLVAEKDAARKPDEDSITEEIAQLPTPEVEKKHSDWSDDEEAGGLPRSDSRSSRVSRMVRQFFCCGVAYEAPSEDNISKIQSPKVKKEISWEDKEYQDNVVLNEMIARSEAWMLDRKASVGPCFRPGMPFEGPSGITICLPQKSLKAINQPSGISINISKKSMSSKTKMEGASNNKKKSDDKGEREGALNKFFSNMKDKLANIQSKVKKNLQE